VPKGAAPLRALRLFAVNPSALPQRALRGIVVHVQALAIAVVVFAAMIVEARRAARNERAQRRQGGVEPAGDVYKWMRLLYPAAFAAMIAEGVWRGAPPGGVAAGGAIVFAGAKLLKWWAIVTLGPFWTFRVIVVPGRALVSRGPYRWLRHPNYVGVVGELLGVALMTGAVIAAPVMSATFTALLLKRIRIETRALNEARLRSPTS